VIPRNAGRRRSTHLAPLLLALLAALPLGCERQRPSASDDERRADAVDAELNDARDALNQGNTDAALEAVDRARAVDPESHRPLLVRGRILMLADRFAESRAAYQSAARLADQSAANAIARSASPPTADEDDNDPDAAFEHRQHAIQDAADAHLAAGNARLMAAFVHAEADGPAAPLPPDALDDADDAFNQAVATADMLHPDFAGDRGQSARLHLALINALRGNKQAALTQIDMLEVGHRYDPDLADFWRQVINDGTLRARLTQADTAP